MFLVAGALAIACTYTPIAHPSDLWLLRMLRVADFAIAAGVYRFPWERLPSRALLVVPVLAYAMIGVFESAGALTAYTYPIFFIVVSVWIGLCLPPRTSLLLAPIAIVSRRVRPVYAVCCSRLRLHSALRGGGVCLAADGRRGCGGCDRASSRKVD